MAKTEVILTHNIVGLGGESDQVRVAAGYARNYLFPQGFAVAVTGVNKRRLEALKQRRAEREAHELNTMTELSKSLSKLICVITVKTGDDGKMFGSVTSGMIADQLKTQFDVTLEKRKIHLASPIRAVGEHDIELRLHADVTTTLKLRVESTTPPPAVEAPAGPEGKREDRRTEKRGRRPDAAPEKVEGKVEGGERKPRAPRPDRSPRSDKGPRPERAAKGGDKGTGKPGGKAAPETA
jgi:large subunit ribosomal protein L9